jgi:CheY-like chemotaxis protein
VDDNVDAATSLRLLLKLLGHETLMAHTGQEAIVLTGRFSPDIIFLDIGLPAMNGYEVARAIRLLPDICQPRLIALTGWGSEEDKRYAREVGFDHHLTKPVDAEEVEETLRRLSTVSVADPR